MTTNIIKIVCCMVCVISVNISAAPSSKLPNGYIQCQLSGPDFDGCLKDAAQKAIPHLVKGIPSLKMIPVDPLHMIKLEIDQRNSTGPVKILLKFLEVDLIGIKTALVNKVHYDPENYNLYLDFQNPKPIQLIGDYEISGKIFTVPIAGNGKSNVTIEVSKIVCNVQLRPVERKGEIYFDIEKIDWQFTPTHLILKFDNLFNGDKALGEFTNMFLNENWREILADIKPAMEEVLGIAYKEIGQQFLNRIPLNQIYID